MNFIKKKRLEHECTQSQLAKKIGVSQSAVACYEQSLFVPRANVLKKMSQFFQCSPDEILQLDTKNETMQQCFLNIVKNHCHEICKKLCSGFSWEEIAEDLKSDCIENASWNSAFDHYLPEIHTYYAIAKDIYVVEHMQDF